VSLKMVPFESSNKVSCSHSIVTIARSYIIFEIKRGFGRKSRFFHTPAFEAPLAGSQSTYCDTVLCEKKTRMVWLPDCGKSLRICLAISTQYGRLTHRQIDKVTGTLSRTMTSSPAVSKWPRDASCLPVVSFNSTKR